MPTNAVPPNVEEPYESEEGPVAHPLTRTDLGIDQFIVTPMTDYSLVIMRL